MITNRNSAVIKSQGKKSHKNIYQQQLEDNGTKKDEGEDKDDNNTPQTMWTEIPHCTQFEYRLGHNAVPNCAMPYLVALIMTGPEFLEDSENNLINPWPERNSMALDKMMIKIWNK